MNTILEFYKDYKETYIKIVMSVGSITQLSLGEHLKIASYYWEELGIHKQCQGMILWKLQNISMSLQ